MRSIWLFVASLGCGNGGTGTEGGSGAPFPLPNADAVCDGVAGLTANGLLSKVPMPTKATFTYFGKDGGMPTSPFTLDVAYMGGTITCTPHHDPPPGSDAPSTPASIRVVVVVGFKTDDGAFAETGVSGTLDGALSFFSLVANEPASAVKGTYKPTLTSLSVTGSFGAMAPSGQVGEGGGNSTTPVGSWK